MVNKKRLRIDSQAALFRAAAHEFAQRGFDAGGVDRIAALARVNKAMLYYHYGSKLGLYEEVLRDMFRAVGARARAIADGPGAAEAKLDAWILTLVQEAAARPWFPPIMLRELASGATHIDAETFGMMNGVYEAVRDVIVQGQREGTFREADPLLTYLTILPAVLIFFARQRLVVKQRKHVQGLAAAAPRHIDEFTQHMQVAARAMLRRQT
ncbi:MAG: TetR/AcrR family transcriptional regulator [Acidobacteria bacterium]|nr:TetR/AcrR family transcriptional regulator [Acidobacteriota bacterium]